MKIQITSGKKKEPQFILLYGLEGMGKSTWAASLPNPIFADTERGSTELDISRQEIPNWNDLHEFIDYLMKEDHDFKTLVIDTLQDSIIFDQICKLDNVKSIAKANGGYGNGYKLAAKMSNELCDTLDSLRLKRSMHIVIITHAGVVKFEDPLLDKAYDRYSPIMDQKYTSPVFERRAKNVFFINSKMRSVEGKAEDTGERVIETLRTAAFNAKNRHDLEGQYRSDDQALLDIFHEFDTRTNHRKLIETVEGWGMTGDQLLEYAKSSNTELNDHTAGKWFRSKDKLKPALETFCNKNKKETKKKEDK